MHMTTHTHVVLVANPDKAEFDSLMLLEQVHIKQLCTLVLSSKLVPPNKLPVVLCQWWCKAWLVTSPYNLGCWIMSYAQQAQQPQVLAGPPLQGPVAQPHALIPAQ